MKLTKFGFVLMSFLLFSFTLQSKAEEKVKAEDLVDAPVAPSDDVDISKIRRGKLTEEQAVNQMKYLMVKGWARVDKQLREEGLFDPMGLLLDPKGNFRPMFVGEDTNPSMKFVAVTKNLQAIAQQRQFWVVGVMYIREYANDDGTTVKRINVLTEHIAGWARHWSYPFRVVDGEVKLGQPIEKSIAPFYYLEPK